MKVDCTHCGASNSFPGDFYDYKCKYCSTLNKYEYIKEVEKIKESNKKADVEFVMDKSFYKQLNGQGE